MLFAYLDEFGHIGPFVSRTAPPHCHSPVFGLAGMLLPEASVRPFATRFLQLKSFVFKEEIERSGKLPQVWEKKGSSIFRPKAIERYPEIKHAGFRLINLVKSCGGRIVYYGREKVAGKLDGNAVGLYTTSFAHAIRRIDSLCCEGNENFIIIIDEHSARKELLECAAKTMFGNTPAKRLISPPFEVESYVNQSMQAADWLAAIIGRLWAFELQPMQYSDHQQMHSYFWDRIHTVASHSTVFRRHPFKTSAQVVTLAVETMVVSEAGDVRSRIRSRRQISN